MKQQSVAMKIIYFVFRILHIYIAFLLVSLGLYEVFPKAFMVTLLFEVSHL